MNFPEESNSVAIARALLNHPDLILADEPQEILILKLQMKL
jgi:ABC-type lipoprotein export system ATPase subunit